jgi:hypothetical protein
VHALAVRENFPQRAGSARVRGALPRRLGDPERQILAGV